MTRWVIDDEVQWIEKRDGGHRYLRILDENTGVEVMLVPVDEGDDEMEDKAYRISSFPVLIESTKDIITNVEDALR